MNNELSDKTVILIIVATLILVFSLIFSLRTRHLELEPSLEWRDSKIQYNGGQKNISNSKSIPLSL